MEEVGRRCSILGELRVRLSSQETIRVDGKVGCHQSLFHVTCVTSGKGYVTQKSFRYTLSGTLLWVLFVAVIAESSKGFHREGGGKMGDSGSIDPVHTSHSPVTRADRV